MRVARRRRTAVELFVLLVASCAAPGAAAVARLSAPGPDSSPAPVAVRYLANEGVLLAAGDERVLIDALFGDGIAGYPAVAPAQRANLEAARGDLAGVDLVLATHAHADHFDAGAVVRHLAANPGALFVSTPEAVAAVRHAANGSVDGSRLLAVLPAEGESDTVQRGNIAVTIFQLHHGRELRRPTANLGFLVEIGGQRIVHLGDTEATTEELAATGLAARGVDLALIPFWRLLDAPTRAGVVRALQPKRIAAFHLPSAEAPADWWGVVGGLGGLRRALAADLPDAVVLAQPGVEIRLARALGTRAYS